MKNRLTGSIVEIVEYSRKHNLDAFPRSLGSDVVWNLYSCDISKEFNKIILNGNFKYESDNGIIINRNSFNIRRHRVMEIFRILKLNGHNIN